MSRTLIQRLLMAVAMIAAVGGGFALTNLAQQRVALVPGMEGCWRLEGSLRQADCLSEELLAAADEAAGATTGTERETRITAWVATVEDGAASDERLAGQCHVAMHEVGRREGRTAATADRVPGFPEASSQLCTAGYVHGLAEGYLAERPAGAIAEVFPSLCHDAESRPGCAHGIGHALLQAREGEPIAPAADASLTTCTTLPGEFPVNCANGVFMEMAMRRVPAPVAVDDYVEACSTRSDAAEGLACIGYLGLSLASNELPVADMPALCARAGTTLEQSCLDAYGRELGLEGIAGCGALEGNGARRCVDGAVALTVGSGHATDAEAAAACGRLGGELEGHCTDAVARYARGRDAVEAGTSRT